MAGTTGTAGYSASPFAGNPAMVAALLQPPAGKKRRTLDKQQKAARQRRHDILTALGYTGSMDVRDIAKERPDIIKALQRANAFSGGPGRTYKAANSIEESVPVGPSGRPPGSTPSATTLSSLLSGGTPQFNAAAPTVKAEFGPPKPKKRRRSGTAMNWSELQALGLL